MMSDPRKEWIKNETKELLSMLRDDLFNFLNNKLFELYGKDLWNNGVVTKIKAPQDIYKIESGDWEKLDDLDFLGLIKVTKINLKKIRMKEGAESILEETTQVRHRFAHDPVKGITLFDYRQDIGTLLKFSNIIDVPRNTKIFLNDLLSHVESLYDEEKGITDKIGYKTKQLEGEKEYIDKQIIEINMRDEFEELTKSQENAIENIQKFLKEDKTQCFVLNGYAGTGKTFLIGGIVNYLSKLKKNTVIMAPTGRAARVLSENHQLFATTIHKGIYFLDKLIEYKKTGEATTHKFYFDLLHNDHDQGSVFIVDESSLISDMYSENEFIRFGSGKLLYDLFKFIGFDQNDNYKKIIIIGDNAQLPPVDMKFSPALNSKYLNDNYKVNVLSSTLTDVVRQQKNNKILENATNLRQLISEGSHLNFDFKVDQKNTFEIKNHDIVDIYSKYETDNIDPELMIVVHSNSQADSINKEIRNHLFPGQSAIAFGDRVMVVKNNYNYDIELMNGQIGKVIDISPYSEKKEIPLNVGVNKKGERQTKVVKIIFRKTTLLFRNVHKQEHSIDCMIIENLLYSKQRSLSSDESKALFVDFCNRHPRLNRKSELFKEELLSDMYFNALQIKFAYGVTCHKAQGGEWPFVIVDFSGQNKLKVQSLRWCYTAMTRAKEKLFVINPLYHSMISPIKKYGKNPIQKIEQPIDQGGSNSFGGDELSLDVLASHISGKLKDILSANIKVEVLQKRKYNIKYKFMDDDCSCEIMISYNGRYEISKYSLFNGDQKLYINLKVKLDCLKGVSIMNKSYTIEEGNKYDLAFFANQKPLFDFHIQTFQCLNEKSIQLLNLTLLTKYHLVYHLKSNLGEIGKMNYWFNDSGVLTTLKFDGDTSLDLYKILIEIHGIE